MQIGRHHTGTLHRALGPTAAACSSAGLQRRTLRLRGASAEEVQAASAAMFCKRCFRSEESVKLAKALYFI